MKYEVRSVEPVFKHVEVNLVFETKEELKNFVKAFDHFTDDEGIPCRLYYELANIVDAN